LIQKVGAIHLPPTHQPPSNAVHHFFSPETQEKGSEKKAAEFRKAKIMQEKRTQTRKKTALIRIAKAAARDNTMKRVRAKRGRRGEPEPHKLEETVRPLICTWRLESCGYTLLSPLATVVLLLSMIGWAIPRHLQ